MVMGEAEPSLSDGRGGENTSGREEPKPAHRYIYYRLYTKDGPLESYNSIYSNDPFISRVLSKSVSPPHTGASLTKHLCRTEGFEALGTGSLYLSLWEKAAVEGSARLSLRANHGPGSSHTEPIALIVDVSAVQKRSAARMADAKTLPERPDEPCHVHYRVYDEGGEVASKASFTENDVSLGRIDTLSIPPPHNVASLRSCLIKVEDLPGRNVQLFEDDCGETIMNDDDPISLSSADYPGNTEDEPIAIVYESQKSTSASTIQDSAPSPDLAFSKQIQRPWGNDWSSPDPAWHSSFVGEIFKTDGILRTEKLNNRSGFNEIPCYVAINSAGKKAFVHSNWVKFC